jgi:hypothetical protein
MDAKPGPSVSGKRRYSMRRQSLTTMHDRNTGNYTMSSFVIWTLLSMFQLPSNNTDMLPEISVGELLITMNSDEARLGNVVVLGCDAVYICR